MPISGRLQLSMSPATKESLTAISMLRGPDREQAIAAPAGANARSLQEVFDRRQRRHLDPIGADEGQRGDRNPRHSLLEGNRADEADAAAIEGDRLAERRGLRRAAGE